MNTKKQLSYGFAAGFSLLLFLGVIKFFQILSAMSAQASQKMPPEAVTAIYAKKVSWPEVIESTGSLTPEHGVVISAEVGGVISNIGFTPGANVKKGDLVISLDSSVEEADLRGQKASLEVARKNFERVKKLKATGAISQAEYDRQEWEFKNAQASVDSLIARIEKKVIKAPFDAKVGVQMVNVGEFVEVGTPLVPLYSDDKLYADFAVPQRVSSKVHVGQKIRIYSEERNLDFVEGSVQNVDPQIDEVTRQVRVRGVIPGSDRLKAGMFVKVEVVVDESRELIALPASSIQFAPYGNSVFIIDKIKQGESEYLGVHQRNVEIGPRRGDQVSILKGLNEGQQVATSGLFKLREGAAVMISEGVAPQGNPAPNPNDS